MAMTNYAESAYANNAARGATLTLPAAWHIALFTSATNESGGGTEVSGNGYERAEVTRNTTNFAVATDVSGAQTCVSSVEVAFPESTGSWGAVTHYGFMDDDSGGEMWFYGELPQARTVDSAGITLRIPAGSLSLGFS